ncbi:hypothetical protein BCR33DRAFT_848630 [Rhizoclosmatium globosum]|uniref:Uncharacterized protein n=1 Tax=Rhizoclosmatium globosum TaxID=329046 RepID=A0A1Y2CK62_9FUNG|nr:hypothetical protein BCR33DRAFT_848630 [Rhizoclosmatium globosum]|eukprot:ORY47244.1 hypothetical protein BCR33DRAFT_848630 [Rhizoclosmatium globosum]
MTDATHTMSLPSVWNLFHACVQQNGPSLPSLREQLSTHKHQFQQLENMVNSTSLPSPPFVIPSSPTSVITGQQAQHFVLQNQHASFSPTLISATPTHHQLSTRQQVVPKLNLSSQQPVRFQPYISPPLSPQAMSSRDPTPVSKRKEPNAIQPKMAVSALEPIVCTPGPDTLLIYQVIKNVTSVESYSVGQIH